MLISEECWNPKESVVDGGELTRNINQKKKPGVLQAFIDAQSLTIAIGESTSSRSIWIIVNQ